MARKKLVVKTSQPAPPQLSILDELETQKYTEEQKSFVEYSGKESIILSATAGSGKTFSCVQRLKELLRRGVEPEKIIFFSFTNDAVKELTERIERDGIQVWDNKTKKGIRITTIHSFCLSILTTLGKYKDVADFYKFIEWFKEKYKPSPSADSEVKEAFYETIGNLYEDSNFFSSKIAAYKLQTADKIKCLAPPFIYEYNLYLKESRARDFSDMLIEVRDLFREDKWLKMFRNKYDYIFVDEYQDTSTIQLQILLSLNAPYYYLIGDKNQSIYGYSGANCSLLEEMLKARRETKVMSLSVNFRSDQNIVANSNKFSSLKATANSKEDGFVDNKFMVTIDELIEILQTPEQVAVLVRTNDIIKKLELILLRKKIPMRYFNFITDKDIKNFHKGEINGLLKNKFLKLKNYFASEHEIIHFIEMHKKSNKFITTIHKSKGREFETCVVVNSVSMEILQTNPSWTRLTKKQLEAITFDPDDEVDVEPKNIHYVAVSRSKHKLYFMVFGC